MAKSSKSMGKKRGHIGGVAFHGNTGLRRKSPKTNLGSNTVPKSVHKRIREVCARLNGGTDAMYGPNRSRAPIILPSR